MLTTLGLIPKRFSGVESTLNTDLLATLGDDLDLSPTSIMGVLKSIFSLHETYIWELSQDVYDSTNILSAEDQYLDNLVLLVGNVRSQASRTRGTVWLQADEGYLVSSGDVIKSVTGIEYLVEADTYISPVESLYSKVFVDSLLQNENYSLSVDGNIFKRDETLNQTEEEILTDLELLLQSDGSIETSLVLSGADSYIEITKIDTTQTMELAGTTYLKFHDVITPTLIIARDSGVIIAKEGTITNYVKDNINVSVRNPTDLTTGSDTQSNFDLRNQTLSSYTNISGGTLNTLSEALYEVEGVNSVKILENRVYSINDGLPPNSYKVVVFGGDEDLIGEVLWENSPAGIQCYSDLLDLNTVTVDTLDFNEQSHTVYFLRPETKYIWIYCDYTLYDEESFPDSGEEIIKEELANFGNTLQIGEDVIPDRFYSAIYKNTSGVDDSELYFAFTDNLNDTPSYPADYTQDIISITDEQITNFASVRVQVQEV